MSMLFIKKKIKSYQEDEAGVALIEFALVLPILAIILMGMIEAFFLFDARAKSKRIANTLANLASQEHLLEVGDADDYLNVARHIMWPNDAAASIDFGVSVYEIGGGIRRVWGVGGLQRQGLANNLRGIMNQGIGAGFRCPYIIVGSVRYRHDLNTPFRMFFSGLTFDHDFHYFPRPVDQIRIRQANGDINILPGCQLNV